MWGNKECSTRVYIWHMAYSHRSTIERLAESAVERWTIINSAIVIWRVSKTEHSPSVWRCFYYIVCLPLERQYIGIYVTHHVSPDHATSAIAIALQLEMGKWKWKSQWNGMENWKIEWQIVSLDRTSHLSMWVTQYRWLIYVYICFAGSLFLFTRAWLKRPKTPHTPQPLQPHWLIQQVRANGIEYCSHFCVFAVSKLKAT